MSRITPALLQLVGAQKARAEVYAPLLEAARVVPGDSFRTISSSRGIAMFVAQLAYESGFFTRTTENLKYSVEALQTGNRRKYFTREQAERYGQIRDAAGRLVQPADERMIARLYYGSRLGNRGVHTDDGWVYRGGGLIQLTGRTHYTNFGKTLGMLPEQAAEFVQTTPEGAVKASRWYWDKFDLLVPASRGDTTRCTELIQGGDSGLNARLALYNTVLDALR